MSDVSPKAVFIDNCFTKSFAYSGPAHTVTHSTTTELPLSEIGLLLAESPNALQVFLESDFLEFLGQIRAHRGAHVDAQAMPTLVQF